VDSDFRLGAWLVHPSLNTISLDGSSVRLEPKVMEVLVCLASRPSEPISKEQLLKTVWRDTFVSDDVLTRAVSELRRAFQDDPRNPSFIETIPKRGYRLVAPVERDTAVIRQFASTVTVTPRIQTRHKRILGLGLGLATALLVFAVLGKGSIRSMHWLSRNLGFPLIRSIAVLPLKNLSGDSQQEYYAQGMTEELITNLSQIQSLKVISGTSASMYENTTKSVPEIARELKVEGIVTGSVQRSDGQVRITARLIYAPDDENVWAQAYVRNAQSALTLQTEVAEEITREIERTLSYSRPPEHHTVANPVNQEAYDFYLKGRYYWNQRTQAGFWKAIESFRQAIEKDPNYASAYAGLADSYILLGPNDVMPAAEVYPLAKTAALKALQLDVSLAEAHASLGFVTLLYDWSPIQAESEFKRAIELNSNYPTAHHWYAYDLTVLKRPDDAVTELKRALELDPISPIINTDLAQILLLSGQSNEAIAQCKKTIKLDPNFPQVYWYLGQLYEQEGLSKQAFEAFMKSGPDPLDPSEERAFRAAYGASGIKGYWQHRIAMLERQSRTHYVSPFTFGVSYARLGQTDRALDNLEKAFQERYPSMIFLAAEPVFASLHSDPRFQDLVRRVSLPH
jgi:TolB-like protein/DNA-binding winged helix-turn-helix (wHTH) protein/Tfp pilus assembly protein PilF